MKIVLHKGTKEIGGNCIELNTGNTSILLDYGLPLKPDSDMVDLSKNRFDAVIISHSHQDHYGLIDKISHEVPIYTSKLNHELIQGLRLFLKKEPLENRFKFFKAWKTFTIGEFKITPYLVDHSASDSYGFLVKAGKKSIFYSGDFRSHGRKGKLFDKFVQNPPKGIDALFMEGTMLNRSNDDFKDEYSVEEKIYTSIKDTKGLSFFIGSSQNIDRIVSAYRACKKSNKIFVIDIYTAWILEKFKLVSKSIPNISWENIKVISRGKYASYYYSILKENRDIFGEFTNEIYRKENNIDIDEIIKNPSSYFLKISHKYIAEIIQAVSPKKSTVIYSQWAGYLEKEHNESGYSSFLELKDNPNINFIYAHTSGHAVLEDLIDFARALNPKQLVPIHTDYPMEYKNHFNNVHEVADGQEFSI